MGTNYYLKPKLSDEDLKKMHQMVDAKKIMSDISWYLEPPKEYPYTSLEDMIDYFCKTQYHICKMSCGWFTCFDHNWGKYWQPNRKSLEEWLSKPDFIIKDEYGQEMSFKDFWDKVNKRDSLTKSNGEPLWDSKSYTEWEKKQHPEWVYYPCKEDRKKVKEKFNIDTDSDDFKVDNLRFAVYSDFS